MTKPLGHSDSRDIQDNHRTFYGQPIVVRVKDLTWQPPAPEAPPAQDAWVSNLLGEDPYEASSEDSLLVGVSTPAAYDEPIGPLPRMPQTIEKPKPRPASITPTYLRHKGENRRNQLTNLILGHSKKALGLGSLALSLIVFSYWMLAGDADTPPVDDVEQELFVQIDDNLGSAPAWPPATSSPESETTTIGSTGQSVHKMASLPTRDDSGLNTPAQYNTNQTQMPMIATPEVEMGGNPAYLQNPATSPAESIGGYVPSFSPTGDTYSGMGETSPAAGNDSLPTGGDIPNFDGDGQDNFNTQPDGYVPSFNGNMSGYGEPSQPAASLPVENNSPYPSTNSGGENQGHWMLEEGTLTPRTGGPTSANSGISGGGMSGSGMTNQAYQSQLPSIQNGAPQGQNYPHIETAGQYGQAPYYAENPPASQMGNSLPGGQGNSGFSFNPNGGSYGTPAAETSEGPRSAARLGGNIESFDSRSGIR